MSMIRKQQGFTLVEVLISALLLGIGLLGLAGLQSLSLANNQTAYNLSQATVLASDLADRVRANVGAADNYVSSALLPEDATEQADCLTTTGCSPAQMAEQDLFEWQRTLAAALPSGSGRITRNGGTYTITLTWDDDKDGDATNNPNFSTEFQL